MGIVRRDLLASLSSDKNEISVTRLFAAKQPI
jgi:hypothetical protein